MGKPPLLSHKWMTIGLLLCGLLLPLGFVGCRRDDPVWPSDGKIRVLTSFPPLYCFAQNVAGDDANVMCLLTTEGPHGYQADHRDIMKARNADLFLLNGLELDEFVVTVANSANNSKALYEVTEVLPRKMLLRTEPGEQAHGPGEHHHHHGEYDPHLWLSPPHAILMVEAIAAKLGEIDAKNKSKYQDRAAAYIGELKKLHAFGKAELAKKGNRKVISTHDALRYFGQAFDVEILDNIQPRPGIEPGGGKMSELVKVCQEKGVRVIAVEPQYPTADAETLKSEAATRKIELKLVEIDTLETAPSARDSANPHPGYYLKRMYQNIENLTKALP